MKGDKKLGFEKESLGFKDKKNKGFYVLMIG
jgi:hypothetical protein